MTLIQRRNNVVRPVLRPDPVTRNLPSGQEMSKFAIRWECKIFTYSDLSINIKPTGSRVVYFCHDFCHFSWGKVQYIPGILQLFLFGFIYVNFLWMYVSQIVFLLPVAMTGTFMKCILYNLEIFKCTFEFVNLTCAFAKCFWVSYPLNSVVLY